MKAALTLFAILVSPLSNGIYNLTNTVWTYKVTKGCVDTYKFRSVNLVDDYDCELNYTFKCTYQIAGDTLIIVEKDDSHSEDNNKITYYRRKYKITKNALLGIGYEKLVNGKWLTQVLKVGRKAVYRRVNP